MSFFIAIGALLGGVAVALGAFGAHALKSRLAPAKLTSFETGVRYQFYHALALLFVGLLYTAAPGNALLGVAGWLFVAGVLFFSGSIYWLAFDGPRWLGPVTPLGGLCFIVAWVLLAVAAL
ncbi:MAG: DUF423 domain-containing protein [Caldilineaceae bacterium]|nr:DUF423 domain-containing protein [Caldilineaceae bacterium]